MNLDKLAELGKVERSQSRGGIPSRLGGKTVAIATLVGTRGDIAKGRLDLGRVEERVGETDVGLTLGLTVVVEKTEQSSDSGGRSRGTEDRLVRTTDVNLVEEGDERDVRVTTVVGVEALLLGAVEGSGVGLSNGLVIVGSSEDLGVATAGGLGVGVLAEVGDDLAVGFEAGTADTGDVGARAGEEAIVSGAAGRLAVATDTVVTGGEEDGDTTGSGLHEFVADRLSIGLVNATLLDTVRGRDNRGRVGVVVEVVSEGEQGVVEAVSVAAGRANGEVLALEGAGDTTDVLGVEVALEGRAVAVVVAAVDADVLEVLEAGDVLLAESAEVGVRSTDVDEAGGGDEAVSGGVVVNVIGGLDVVGGDGGTGGGAGTVVVSDTGADGVEQRSGGSDYIDDGVEVLGNGVLGGTGDLVTRLRVDEPLVLGVQEALHLGHGDGEFEPTSGGIC